MPRTRRAALVLGFLLSAALTAGPGYAQQGQPYYQPIVSNFDYDSATATYCVLGAQHSSSLEGLQKIQTSGSSATVTAVSGTPYTTAALAAGSELTVRDNAGTSSTREVLAVGSGSSLTVNAVITLTATEWSYRNLTCGTGAQAGWFGVGGLRDKKLAFQVDQLSLASGSLAITVQCKGPSPWAKGVQVYPPVGGSGQCGTGLFTTATTCALWIPEPWSYCRIGVALTDDGGDTGANLEQVTAYLEGFK